MEIHQGSSGVENGACMPIILCRGYHRLDYITIFLCQSGLFNIFTPRMLGVEGLERERV